MYTQLSLSLLFSFKIDLCIHPTHLPPQLHPIPTPHPTTSRQSNVLLILSTTPCRNSITRHSKRLHSAPHNYFPIFFQSPTTITCTLMSRPGQSGCRFLGYCYNFLHLCSLNIVCFQVDLAANKSCISISIIRRSSSSHGDGGVLLKS